MAIMLRAYLAGCPRRSHPSNLRLMGATGLDEVRSAFARTRVDHVIMGAGIDLETRLQIVRHVFRSSDSTPCT